MITNTFLLSTLIICSVSQKPPIHLKPKNNEISECQTCKVLTDSFSYWKDNKTSRGKFEGGDAAWEEAKLKPYARSEIRLVEIQEGLCSEVKNHQDKCYGLYEEVELTIEKWWFHEDPSLDLYTWLCIETLKRCCPPQHFGEDCTECPLDKNNKMCSSHGRCDGQGTRQGTGTCICKKGYTGPFCEECSRNYYREHADTCKPCHQSCEGCSGAGAESCTSCAIGWQLQSGLCVDVDECTRSSTCKPDQYCVNLEGSRLCKTCSVSCKTCVGPSSSNCTSCKPSFTLWSGICVDEKLKREIMADSLRRLVLYTGLMVSLYVVCRIFKWLTSIVVVLIAIFVYVSESNSDMSIANVALNLLHSQSFK